MASQQVTLQAQGLNYSPNNLSLPQGSLVQADDVIIRRDNTIESRRGIREYSEGLGISTDRCKQLIEYKDRVLVHYANRLAFDTKELDASGKAIFDLFAGTYLETQTGLRIKSIEANKNLYFTTDEGIKKISAKTAADFTTSSGFITNAGAVKALDITAELDITQGQISGFLPQDSTVAYRMVWGQKDNNDNLLLGTPSNRVEVYNYLSNNMAMDINAMSIMLDNLDQGTSMINDGNYATSFYTPINPEAITLQSNVIELAKKLDNDIYFANITGASVPLTISLVDVTNNICTITFSSGDPTDYFETNDQIDLRNFSTAFVDINGFRLLDFAPTSTTISFTFTHANIASAAPVSGDIYDYNYRNITATGDDAFATPLDDLIISVPATSEQVRTINNTLSRILERLKIEKDGVIPTALLTIYVSPFVLTERANVRIVGTIPSNVSSSDFFQIYRSRIFTATTIETLGGSGGIGVTPDDEMRLVYEAFPTSAEILAGEFVFIDSSPEELVQNNTNLYTNPETGEGLINANEPPPFAKDINRFKNVVFYANTRTKHRISTFQLLGISNIVSGDKITITSSAGSDTYTFVSGVNEVTDIVVTAGGTITAGEHFPLYSANDDKRVEFYFVVDGVGSAPVIPNAVLQPVDIFSTDTDVQVAQKLLNTINTLVYDFQAEENTLPAIRVTNVGEGLTTDATAGTTPFTVTVFQQGNGENASLKQVLLSSLLSTAQAITQTAQSLVRVINKQTTSVVNAYYISGDTTPPGQINLEAKTLNEDPFYVISSGDGIGLSFNPDISPINTNITAISIASPTVVTTSAPHGLLNGNQIVITNSNSTPSIDGLQTVTVLSTTTFSIPVNVTIAGTQAVWSTIADTTVSTNEVKPNRIYYSKIGQPEAVPLLNYFDISAEDKEILRIFPLRDTLFAFKQDGTYRVSGEIAPWSVSLLDSSCVVIAPDSVAVTRNTVYAWTESGITPITETGAGSEISRPIDTEILRLASSLFPNFSSITWGVGYDSDSSYIVFTNSAEEDTVATRAFRYCTLTNTWTNYIRTQTCGLLVTSQDLLYMGAGDKNLIEVERKEFSRRDYADKDFSIQLQDGKLFNDGTLLTFTSVEGINDGDVLTQEQTLTTYGYNSLLRQLDNDPTVGVRTLQSSSGAGLTLTITTTLNHFLVNNDYVTLSGTNSYPSIDDTYKISGATANTFNISIVSPLLTQATLGTVKRSYETTLLSESGDNMRDKIEALATWLDSDPGVSFTDYFDRIDTKSGTISGNSIASPTVVTTSSAHELIPGRVITIGGTQSPLSIPIISGKKEVSSTGVFGVSTTFTIPVNVTTAGGSGLSFDTGPNINSFEDIQACFNDIVNRLNADPSVTFSNYQLITETTLFEAVVLSVDQTLNKLTINLPLQWVVGPMTVYNAINCEFTYAPITMDDPLMSKQISDATFMFNNRAITQFTASFSSDLKPEFQSIEFSGQGNGIFGHYSNPGFGNGFFGGASNSAPFRTIVPRDAQRCRYINMKINHRVARELWSLYGVTLTGNIGISSRTYR